MTDPRAMGEEGGLKFDWLLSTQWVAGDNKKGVPGPRMLLSAQ